MRTTIFLSVLVMALVAASATSCSQETKSSQSKSSTVTESTKRGWLGVSIQDVTPRLARERDLSIKTGACVNEVVHESPAEKAGIEEDDIIIEFNGKTIEVSDDLLEAVRSTAPGTKANVVVMRGSEKKTVQVTLAKEPKRRGLAYSFTMPAVPPFPHVPKIHVFTSHGMLGLSLTDLNRQLGEYFEAPDGRGVLVQEVEKKSAAEKAGFKAGDVIVKIGAEPVESAGDIMDALEGVKKGDRVEFGILRKGAQKTLTVEADELPVSRFHKFRSFHMDGDEGPAIELREGAFKMEMKKLQEHLRSIMGHVGNQMKQLRENLRRELRHVNS